MKRNRVLITAISAGVLSVSALSPLWAQSTAPAPAAAPAPASTPVAVAPKATPAAVALIAFEQAVVATNEGQRNVQEVQKKYEPKKSQIDALASEVDSLKKQLQGSATTLSEEERNSRAKNIDTKEKQLNRDAEDATAAYNADLQEALGKVAQKVNAKAKDYCNANGFTILLDIGGQQSNVLWALQSTDVTQAVVDAYNVSSGIAAPPPSAPSATRPKPTGSTTPRATPKPATTAPKP